MIGRVKLIVEEKQYVSANQVIGYIYVLGQKYFLTLPKVSGQVTGIKNHTHLIDTAYGQELFVLKQQVINDAKTITSNNTTTEELIVAPMDGMFYSSPTPDEPPYVDINTKVLPEQTIGLIEVMKCFYPVKFTGNKKAVITNSYVKNAIPVAAGDKLFTFTYK